MTSSDNLQIKPLVSVVITCYNQGRFLTDAINSVRNQSYTNIEIVVIDDGSTDDTQKITRSFDVVKYYYQSNAGLSAARNLGIARSNGLFIVFLDADDILYPFAVETNLRFLLKNPQWVLVSGAHDKVDEWLNAFPEEETARHIIDDPYIELLGGNYIGMHATVMYRSRLFDKLQFDTGLHACEDYDLYLRVARNHAIGAHAEKIAAYRHHGTNMSRDYVKMLTHVMKVHDRQTPLLKDQHEKDAWVRGRRTWRNYYAERIYTQCFNRIESDRSWPSFSEMKIMAVAMPGRFKDLVIKKTVCNSLDLLKRSLPDRLLKLFHHAGLYRQYTPPPGKIQAGDFNRVTPFSADFGFDRGGAIDRFYIESFLEENRCRVKGRVLEIGDNEYTLKFGGQKVAHSDILHIDHRNTRATYIGDITDVPQIPSSEFDCIIFTQTLHLIYDFRSALKTCYRILKPGGCLLLTVPGISHIDRGEWREYWLWSFTSTSIRKLMADTFSGCAVEVKTYGNVFVAAAFLYGMGLPEFKRDFLFHHDPSYQVIISAAVVKT